MALFNSLNVSASGMTAQRVRSDIIAQNIANVSTTRDKNGEVYKRQNVVFAERDVTGFSKIFLRTAGSVGSGVKVTSIYTDDQTPTRMVYDPSHPDANEEGYVEYPNVTTVQEMTDLIDASRSYEANITAFNAAKNMALRALDIGK